MISLSGIRNNIINHIKNFYQWLWGRKLKKKFMDVAASVGFPSSQSKLAQEARQIGTVIDIENAYFQDRRNWIPVAILKNQPFSDASSNIQIGTNFNPQGGGGIQSTPSIAGSSNVLSIAFFTSVMKTANKGTLGVRFQNDHTERFTGVVREVRYDGVPIDVFVNMYVALSKGKFVWETFRRQDWPFRRINYTLKKTPRRKRR